MNILTEDQIKSAVIDKTAALTPEYCKKLAALIREFPAGGAFKERSIILWLVRLAYLTGYAEALCEYPKISATAPALFRTMRID
jgi:hypothetical protein